MCIRDSTVTVRRDTLLSRILGQDTVLVNSQHHQAVDKVAPGLVLSALSEDGIVEGIEKPDAKFCLGVQWHPEWLSAADPAMQGLSLIHISSWTRCWMPTSGWKARRGRTPAARLRSSTTARRSWW